jgi:hypothetical protein
MQKQPSTPQRRKDSIDQQLKALERTAKQMKLTKNYGSLCQEALKQRKYRYYDRYPQGAENLTCVICQKVR